MKILKSESIVRKQLLDVIPEDDIKKKILISFLAELSCEDLCKIIEVKKLSRENINTDYELKRFNDMENISSVLFQMQIIL